MTLHRFRLNAIVVVALLLTQVSQECALFWTIFDAVDIATTGQQSGDPAVQAAGRIGESLDEHQLAEERAKTAVEQHDITAIDSVIDDKKNDANFKFLKAAMQIAQGYDRVSVALSMAAAKGTMAGARNVNDPDVQTESWSAWMNAQLQVMDSYEQGSEAWETLRTVYCADLRRPPARPGLDDFLEIASFPDRGC